MSQAMAQESLRRSVMIAMCEEMVRGWCSEEMRGSQCAEEARGPYWKWVWKRRHGGRMLMGSEASVLEKCLDKNLAGVIQRPLPK